MSLVHTIVAFVVALGVLIVVHEYGHYLAARLCGVKVLRFSVGFGRPLALWRSGPDRTEWVIAAVPFGGYVKMLDEREGDVPPAELGRAFNRQSVGRTLDVLAERPGRKPGQLIGRTPYLQAIHFDGAERLIGRMVSVNVTAAFGVSLAGRVAVQEEEAA